MTDKPLTWFAPAATIKPDPDPHGGNPLHRHSPAPDVPGGMEPDRFGGWVPFDPAEPIRDEVAAAEQLVGALRRITANAEHIFAERSVRDWGETLAEAHAALTRWEDV